MTNFHVLTLFPEIIYGGLNHSILKRAIDKNIININCINIRDFSNDKNKRVDDYPYGGGYGMLMQAQPIYDAYKSIKKNCRVIYLSPQGKIFNQKTAYKLSMENDIILLCGHYEGIDQRIIDEIVTDEISVGDYILTGGEIPAMILIDSIARLIPNVLGKTESFCNESFENNLLEYPQYTRPEIFNGRTVPEILLSGNHNEIKKWRLKQSFINTVVKRPDLLKMEDDKMNAIFTRRSIRKYKNEPISDEQLEILLKAGMSAPSAMNSQNWEFVIVRDKNHLSKLSTLNPYHQMLKDSALAIVVCGNTSKILGDEYWIQNCSAATQNILIQANEMGLGAVWLGVAPYEEKMKKISDNLNLPDYVKPLGIISIGVPDEFKQPQNNFSLEKIHYEKF
jgi:tRNA (guanine-N1)-methyltransferase